MGSYQFRLIVVTPSLALRIDAASEALGHSRHASRNTKINNIDVVAILLRIVCLI
jgi:hypothetical protein